MKPKEYVKRFNLNEDSRFNRKEFIKCLLDDFQTSLNLKKLSVSHFSQCVSEIKAKLNQIFNDTKVTDSEQIKFWKFFYATEIIPIRNFYFPNWKDSIHEYKMATDPHYRTWFERERSEKEFDNWIFGEWYKHFSDFMRSVKDSILGSNYHYDAVNQAKEILGIPCGINWTSEDVNERYRKMSKLTHPDVGGNPEVFIKLKTARDFLLGVCSE